MKKVLIKGENISKVFEKNDAKTQVLNQVNIDIYEGDFTIIMGSSGAGKSTLLYGLSGMDSITKGVVSYKGKKITDLSEKQMAKLRSEDFGFIFQEIQLVSNLSLFENVAVPGYINKKYEVKDVEKRAKELLREMGVERAENRLPSQISGGEAQRGAVARAMINDPGIIFADEPTGALNKANTERVLDLLSELNKKGQSILMVTHDLRGAIRGNRILYLEDGKILDELRMPAYSKDSGKEREEKISEWLSSLQW